MTLNTGLIINGRYRIAKLLGEGGFGAVYQAWDLNLDQLCALKMNLDTSQEAQRQFQKEAAVLAKLSHPNLPRVTDRFFVQGQGQFLVMDFVDGEDLESMMSKGAIQPEQAIEWIRQVADALNYLHSQPQPIIHRDIKPANIRVTPNGRAVLVDFGLVKVYDAHLKTTIGARAVTPGYSPPEQYGRGSTDAQTDIYALAATLYTLLTSEEPPESIQRIVEDTLKPVTQVNSGIGTGVEQAIAQAMSLAPSQRYGTVLDFTDALQETKKPVQGAATQRVQSTPPSQSKQSPQKTGNTSQGGGNSWIWWTLGAIGIFIVIGIVASINSSPETITEVVEVTRVVQETITEVVVAEDVVVEVEVEVTRVVQEQILPTATSTPRPTTIPTPMPTAESVTGTGTGAALYTEIVSTVSGVVYEDEITTHEFDGVAGGVINVVITPTDDDLDAVVDIWDVDGNSIIGGEVDEAFDVETLNGIVLPADGTYYVVIRGFAGGGGGYELIFNGGGSRAAPISTGEGGGAISYGDLVTSDVTSNEGSVWTFVAHEGDFVDVTVNPDGDFDVVVDVVDSAGNSMLPDGAVDASFNTEFMRVVPITTDGQYAIIVTPYSDGEVGTYDLVLNETLLEGAGSILFVYNEFTDPEDEGFIYPFTASASEYVTLYAVPDSLELDVVLGVYYEATGELIEEIDNSTGREEIIFFADELDNYFSRVTSYEGSIGGFDLALSGSENVIFEIVADNRVIGRFINGETLTYGYYGEAGTTVTFIIESDDSMDMVINIEDMDKNILANMDDKLSGDGEVLTYTFGESLYIFVNVSEFYGDTGQFVLHIE